MKFRPIPVLILMATVVAMSSCKFYFSESEYLGTYPGEFASESSLYTTCNGTLTLTDVGDNRVDIEIVSDSNATIYFTNVLMERGYALSSSSIFFRDPADNIEGAVTRSDHYLYLYYYPGPSYHDYSFRGKRQ